jgi:hypothetical protein
MLLVPLSAVDGRLPFGLESLGPPVRDLLRTLENGDDGRPIGLDVDNDCKEGKGGMGSGGR